jgi:hypothetical protein
MKADIGRLSVSKVQKIGILPMRFAVQGAGRSMENLSIDGSREKWWFEMDCSLEGRGFELAVPRRIYSRA